MVVRVSPKAAARIRERGGRVYLWEQAFGSEYVRDRLAFDRLAGPWDFECFEATGVQVCIDREVRAGEVRVESRRWPLRGVRAWVDGRPWGGRGDYAAGFTAG